MHTNDQQGPKVAVKHCVSSLHTGSCFFVGLKNVKDSRGNPFK